MKHSKLIIVAGILCLRAGLLLVENLGRRDPASAYREGGRGWESEGRASIMLSRKRGLRPLLRGCSWTAGRGREHG